MSTTSSKGNEVVIVDEFTGRTMVGRRWSDGLHQAVEAKEGLPIQNETITIASVTYQAFFRAFPKLGGMTGTAETELTEFNNIYDLSVQVVPTNRTAAREDSQDVVFRNETGKWNAVRREIARMHKKGRPVLVGTTSVERSEEIGRLLDEDGNRVRAPQRQARERPARVRDRRAVRPQGRVTIATNMAGRGTDILLGGSPEFMARLRVREALMPRVVMPEEGDIAFEKKKPAAPTRTSGASRTVCTRGRGSPPRRPTCSRRLSTPPWRRGASDRSRRSTPKRVSPSRARRLPPTTTPRSRPARRSTRWRRSSRW